MDDPIPVVIGLTKVVPRGGRRKNAYLHLFGAFNSKSGRASSRGSAPGPAHNVAARIPLNSSPSTVNNSPNSLEHTGPTDGPEAPSDRAAYKS
jgi:hypothetical protein